MPRTLKILLVSRRLDISGITACTLGLAEGLRRANQRVAVVTAGGTRLGAFRDRKIALWERPALDSFWRAPLMARVEWKPIVDFKPDVIHIQSLEAIPMGLRLCARTGAPAVVTAHRDPSGQSDPTAPEIESVIAVGETLREDLINHARVRRDSIHVVPNGVEVDRYAAPPPEDRPGRPLVVGAMGCLEKRRGFEFLIRAAAEIIHEGTQSATASNDPDAPSTAPKTSRRLKPQFVVIGDGPERPALVRLADELGVRPHMVFPGEIADPRAALAEMDIFVNPALEEAFGLPALEAMATGRPVVTTSAGGAFSLVEDGTSGFVVPARDPAAISGRLRRLLDDSELRVEMGLRGNEIARERFSRSMTVDLTIQIYRKLVQTKAETQAIENAIAAGQGGDAE